jgi:rhodanese-related sulfurtransferase
MMFRSLVAYYLIAIMFNLLVSGVLPVLADEADSPGAQPPASNTGKMQEVTADEAAEGIVEGHFDIVLDVRRPEEYEQTHIPGAVLIPLGKLREDAHEKLGNPATPVLVYCAVGGRSLEAVKILSKMGFKNVVNLRGGIRAWKKEGYPVAK